MELKKILLFAIAISLLLSLASCQTLLGYKAGYDRSSLDKWVNKRFDKIGVEIELPEHHRIETNNNKYLTVDLHTFYPDDMLVEWTTIFFLDVTKFSEDEYSNPKYYQKYVNAPAFYHKAKYIEKEEPNMRLGTNIVHLVTRHIRDKNNNIYNISIRVYPWPGNKNMWIEEDIEAAFRIANSLKLL